VMDDNKKVQQLTLILMALLFVLLALGIAGNGDIEAEQDSAKVYTEMVCKGYWPDYEQRRPSCDTVQSVAE
jgi:hypothetical protein